VKSIEKTIKEILLSEKSSGSIHIDDSHFLAVLLEKGNSKKLWNFVGLFVAAVLCLTTLITSFVFFINDVLLFQNTPKINQFGAIIPERSCKRETAIFLFCAAQRWENTGIQLQDKDEIKISYSGGFHSDAAGLSKSTESNDTLRYRWISFSNESNKALTKGLLFDSTKGGYFGSLLYVIAGEMGVDDKIDTNIVQVKQNTPERIKQNGILYLALNDIYLSPTIIAHHEKQNQQLFDKETIATTLFNSDKTKKDRTDLFFHNHRGDSVHLHGAQFQALAHQNKDLFYQDNLGEVMVVIDIKRHIDITPFHWQKGLYRWTEEKINKTIDNWNQRTTTTLLGGLLPFVCALILRKTLHHPHPGQTGRLKQARRKFKSLRTPFQAQRKKKETKILQ
jgi:hypothetical protein